MTVSDRHATIRPGGGHEPRAAVAGRFHRNWRLRLGLGPREDDLNVIGAAVAEKFGFRHFLLGIRVPMQGTPQQFVWNDLPPEWLKRYAEERPIEEDPIVQRAYRSTPPFYWDEMATTAGRRQNVLKISTGFGLVHGLTVPLAYPVKTAAVDTLSPGLFSLSRATPLPPDFEYRKELSTQVAMFALLMHEHALAMQLGALASTTPAPRGLLTAREKEVLRLTAKGLTAVAIGKELGVAASTVAYHVDQSCKKLGVDSRRAAVGRALALGEISTEAG